MKDYIEYTKQRLLDYRDIKPSPDGRFNDCWYWTKGTNNKGYGMIFYNKMMTCHRLSAHFHLGLDLNNNLKVLHKCDNPLCYNPEHLFIGTMKDNMEDMSIKGRSPRGCKQGRSKLKDNEIIQIRQLLDCNRFTQQQIGDLYLVSRAHIGRIQRRINWNHI